MATISLALLQHVAHGQSQRTILEKSKYGYMTKVKVMTEILNRADDIRIRTLVTDENGTAQKHIGEASKIFKLQLPMSEETAQLLFAAISIDDSLPKKRKTSLVSRMATTNPDDNERHHSDDESGDPAPTSQLVDLQNPAKNKITVTAQTYQNYKSALKWWHAFDCPEMDKVGYPFPAHADDAIQERYRRKKTKRDYGSKGSEIQI